MAVIKALGLFISAVLSRLVADDLKAWTPRMTRRLIRWATMTLPLDSRARYDEEWQSHVNEVPGEFGKLFACFGFLLAARKMAAAMKSREERINVYDIMRRASDFCAGALMCFLALPLLAAVSLLIRLTSGGPILKSEKMVGLRGRKFSMITWNTAGRLGRFSKRSSLETVPVLINVMRGDMSLVGPRACPPRMHELASAREPRWTARVAVRPGIISWADANAPGTWREELDHDLFYIENRGLKLDWRAVRHAFRQLLFNEPPSAREPRI